MTTVAAPSTARSATPSGTWTFTKLGRLIAPDSKVAWMSTFAGAAGSLQIGDGPLFDLYVTGRDAKSRQPAGPRSLIGRIRIRIGDTLEIVEVASKPALELGELGAFDENGVSYPCIVRHGDCIFMYYTGWMPTVRTPFQNHVGLAVSEDGRSFCRVSRAPILERTNDEPFSLGSTYVLKERDRWRMWYTAWLHWGTTPAEPKHSYVIKYAESDDGIHWRRDDHVCIGLDNPGEHSIARPSVLRINGLYHMWYCFRGDTYRIGWATSRDGIHWRRRDDEVGLPPPSLDWESHEQCHPHVFRYGQRLFLLYSGNGYGREGLGVAVAEIDK